MSAMSWGMAAATVAVPWRRKTRAPLLLLPLLLLILGFFSGTVVAERSKRYQMSDVCKKYFLRDLYRKIDGAVLTSQNERELDCAITFQTHSILQRFMLRFDQLQLDCNDHLYIYDGAHAVGSYKQPRTNRGNKYCNTDGKNNKVLAPRPIMSRSVFLVQIYVYVAFVVTVTVAFVVTADREKCDKIKCPGPLRYYESLRCKPVYENEGDCCAKKYNCDHLKERSTNKCYVNDKEYEIGEALKAEDANPCDIDCTCKRGSNDDGVAAFVCNVDCPYLPIRLGCYRQGDPSKCLLCDEGEEICPEKPEDRATCVVDGEIYQDGENFEVKNEPELSCICLPGYEGKNIEPFCVKRKRPYCSPEFYGASYIHQNCAPVFYYNQSPQLDCHLNIRCQNANDTVIHNRDDLKPSEDLDDENVCLFGNMKLHIGDELNRDTDYDSVCVKCICEVPPVPTCRHLPHDECDITKHFTIF